jgi:hypothetical protein
MPSPQVPASLRRAARGGLQRVVPEVDGGMRRPGQAITRPRMESTGSLAEEQQRPGFEPGQPIPSRPGAYVAVCLTWRFTADVCWDVQVYAHRL